MLFKFMSGMAVVGCIAAFPAHAVPIGGVEFPDGTASFADGVVDYSPGMVGTSPAAEFRGAANALGAPDYNNESTCADAASCTFVTLGDGGSITLRFTDNVLTGSDDSDADLHIFEVGSDVEDTFVEVSADGIVFTAVGKVFGAVSSIDIDAFGFTSADALFYVRLTDDGNEGGQSGASVGADIDAVGAISTRRIDVPEPGAVGLLGLGLLALAGTRRRAR